jgi:D-3-phosphoglycerate dehydrogenase
VINKFSKLDIDHFFRILGKVMIKVCTTTSSFGDYDYPPEISLVKNPYGRRLTEEEAGAYLTEQNPAGLIAGVEPLTRKVLEGAPSLKVISRCGVGLDSVDVTAARDLGIAVLNTPEAPVMSVAELTLGLILAVLRHIPELDRELRLGNWPRKKGRLLSGKTVGIAGCGRIGTKVAELILPFGVECLGYDPFMESHPLCSLVKKDELLKRSDIITLHLPLTLETRNFLARREFGLMKAGAVVINTARGDLINEQDLEKALNAGKLGGAGLDVYHDEPYRGPLTGLKAPAVLTPHTASSAREARRQMELDALGNLIEELRNKGILTAGN